MPPNGKRDAHVHAEEICDHVRRRLQEMREARGKSRYALAQESGVSRDMIGRIESRDSVPTVYLLAKLAYALGTTLDRLFGWGHDAEPGAAGAEASDISD